MPAWAVCTAPQATLGSKTTRIPPGTSRAGPTTRPGRSVDGVEYYRAFQWWRLAAIVEGAFVLFRYGKVNDDYSRKLEYDVPALLQEAALIAGLRTSP